jgi:hypothetical protein
MKRIIVFVLIILFAFFLVSRVVPGIKTQKQVAPPVPTLVVPEKRSAILVLDDGKTIATYSGIFAKNAFEILTIVGNQNNIPIVTKQYDFGVFVQKVGDMENTKDKAWIYSVNGKSGEVAADQYELKNGDVVEWKYTKPLY